MAKSYPVTGYIRHNRKPYGPPGSGRESIITLDDAEAKRLAVLGVIGDALAASEPAAPTKSKRSKGGPKSYADMSRAELVAEAQKRGIDVTGTDGDPTDADYVRALAEAAAAAQ